jgi:hypothetical protein
MKGTLPFIDQVTSVAPPLNASVNSTVFCAFIGLIMSSCMRSLDGATASRILDAAGAHLIVSVPLVDCALAARSTFERSLHAGVLLEWRPEKRAEGRRAALSAPGLLALRARTHVRAFDACQGTLKGRRCIWGGRANVRQVLVAGWPHPDAPFRGRT